MIGDLWLVMGTHGNWLKAGCFKKFQSFHVNNSNMEGCYICNAAQSQEVASRHTST